MEPSIAAKIEQLQTELADCIARLQLPGLPPLGGPVELADWITRTAAERIAELEAVVMARESLVCEYARRIAELEVQLERAKLVVCSYCGHETPREGLSSEALHQKLLDHVVECEKRPEMGMAAVLLDVSQTLGYEGSDPEELVRRAVQVQVHVAELEARLAAMGEALTSADQMLREVNNAETYEVNHSVGETIAVIRRALTPDTTALLDRRRAERAVIEAARRDENRGPELQAALAALWVLEQQK